MFMLNLLFDFANVKGTFSEALAAPVPGKELLASRSWLKSKPGIPVPNPEIATWDVVLGNIESGALLIRGKDDGQVGIRIAPINPLTLDPRGALLTLAVSFGRPTMALQDTSSPFFDKAGRVRCTFVFFEQTSNTADALGNPVGWFFPLGDVGQRPKLPNQTHRYEFSIGMRVTYGGVTHDYGHDPEMDIAEGTV